MIIEEFKGIPGFNDRYSVSNLGNIFDKKRGKLCSQRQRKDGYLDVWISADKNRLFLSHRLVLMAFKGMPTPEKNLARHLDGSKDNNVPDNLEWGDHVENRADRVKHGTASTGIGNIGEKCRSSVLKTKDVIEIKHLLKHTKMFQKDIAKLYGVQREAVSKISLGKRWKHIQLC
jgi:predicted XRE-type DNA-binding protein